MLIKDEVTGQVVEVPTGVTVDEATKWARETFSTRGWNQETHEHLGYLISIGELQTSDFPNTLGWEVTD